MKNGKIRTEEQEIDEMIATLERLHARANDMFDLYCDYRRMTINPGLPSGTIKMMLFSSSSRDVIRSLRTLREQKYGAAQRS